MANLSQLKHTMLATILLTLIIFLGFLMVVSFFFSVAADISLSPWATLLGALAITLIFMFIQYAVGPYIVRVSTRLRYLNPDENKWLEVTVKELSNAAGVLMPKLAVTPDPTPNAFAFGNSANNMTVAVNQGLLARLNEDEIRGVIAHEIGHIKHKDCVIMTFMSAIPLIAYIVVRMAFAFSYVGSSGRRSNRSSGGALILIAGVVALVVYVISQLLVLRLSRLREHFADAFSGYVTQSPRSLESALTRITYGLSLSPIESHGARALYIADPALAKQEAGEIIKQKSDYDLDHDGVLDEHELELAMEQEAKKQSTWRSLNAAFATHPPTYKRILLLRQIEQEIASRGTAPTNIYAHIR